MDGVSPVAEAAFISLEGGGNVQTAINALQAGGGGEGGTGITIADVNTAVAQALIPYSLSTEITAEIAAAIAAIPPTDSGGGNGITINDVNAAVAQALLPYNTAAQTTTAISDAITTALMPYATAQDVNAAVAAGTAEWAKPANADPIPASKLTNAPAGGLSQDDVDARVRAGVSDWAESANADTIPPAKIPPEIARTSELTSAGLSESEVDARVAAGVEDWAETDNTDSIPAAKIPPTIARTADIPAVPPAPAEWAEDGNADAIPANKLTNAPAGGLSQNEVDARVQALVQDWAEQGNTDPIPAEKLTNVMSGGGGAEWSDELLSSPIGQFQTRTIPELADAVAVFVELSNTGIGSGTVATIIFDKRSSGDHIVQAGSTSLRFSFPSATQIRKGTSGTIESVRVLQAGSGGGGGGGDGSGLDEAAVDARVRAGVSDWAETTNTDDIPDAKIPPEVSRTAEVEVFARVGNPAEIVPPEKMVATAQAAIGGSILQLVVNPTTQERRNAYIRAGAALYDPDNNGNPLITSISAMANAPYGVSPVRLPLSFIGGRGINNRGQAGLEGTLITNYGGVNSVGRIQLLYSNRGDYRRTDFSADWESAIGLTEGDVDTLITNGVEVWARVDGDTLIPPEALSPIVLERSGSSFGANVLTGNPIPEGQANARTVAINEPTGDTIKFTLENPQHHIRYVDILTTDISSSEHSVFVEDGISINIRRVGGGDQFNVWFTHTDVNGYSITTIRRSFADGDFVHATDIADFRTETQINDLIAAAIANIPATDLSQYRTAAQITEQINTAIAGIPAIDLSDYRTAAQITAEITQAIAALPTTATWARSGNTGAIPDSKIPASIARDTEVSSRISAEVSEWAHEGDGTLIPDAKIPPEITRDTEVQEAINEGIEAWAIVGDNTQIPASKLTNAPSGGGGSGLPAGGTTGQILAKIDNADGNAEWVDGQGRTWSENLLSAPVLLPNPDAIVMTIPELENAIAVFVSIELTARGTTSRYASIFFDRSDPAVQHSIDGFGAVQFPSATQITFDSVDTTYTAVRVLRAVAGAAGGLTPEQTAALDGIPAGGTTGQVITKASGTDYDTEWTTVGGGGGSNPQSIRRVDGFASVINGIADETVAFRIIGADVLGLPAGEYILEAWEDAASGNDTGQRATNYTTGRVYLRHNLTSDWTASDLFLPQAVAAVADDNRFVVTGAQSINWGNNGGAAPGGAFVNFQTADHLPPSATLNAADGNLILPSGYWRVSFNARVNPATRGNNVRVIAVCEILDGSGGVVAEQSVYIRNGQFGGTNYELIEGRLSISTQIYSTGSSNLRVRVRTAVQSAGMTISLSDVRFTGERVL